jgi:hypothetical protein
MGKRSQAKQPWPTKAREPHTFSDKVTNSLGQIFRIVSKGLTRPKKEELQKQIKRRKRFVENA